MLIEKHYFNPNFFRREKKSLNLNKVEDFESKIKTE